MNSFKQLCREIDQAEQEKKRAAEKRQFVRDELERIYHRHNPNKLDSIDDMLQKYQGKETELLAAVKKKYVHSTQTTSAATKFAHRSYVLKNFKDTNMSNTRNTRKDPRWRNQEIARSLGAVKPALDDMASSIGGRCVERIVGNGHRQLIVESVERGFMDRSKATVEARVEEMRDLVHSRYREPSTDKCLSSEHDRRESAKQKNRKQQATRDQKQQGKGGRKKLQRW